MHETNDETPEVEELEQELATCRHYFLDAIKRLNEAEKRADAAEAKLAKVEAELAGVYAAIAPWKLMEGS